MIRTILTGACAVALAAVAAAPALADEPVTLKLAGMSTSTSYAAVVKAAHKVCRPDHGSEIYVIFMADDCVKQTIDATVAKIGDPALVQYAADRETTLLSVAAN